MKLTTKRITAIDKKETQLLIFEPVNTKDIKGLICIVHGLGEHGARYEHVAQFFTDNNFAVITFDLRGHGKSEGKRGHADSFTVFHQQITQAINIIQNMYPHIPVFIYGHSLGGNITLNYALTQQPKIKGLIISAPWLRTTNPVPAAKLQLAKIMIKIWSSYTEKNGIDPNDISTDKNEVQKYINDPLVHDKISVKLFFEAHKSALNSLENAQLLNYPTLLMHGTADNLTSPNASKEFAEKNPTKVTFKLWQNLFHELHNEPARLEVLTYVLQWINKQINV